MVTGLLSVTGVVCCCLTSALLCYVYVGRVHDEELRFARVDSQIRANRPIRANHLRVPEQNPFFLRIALRGTKTETHCESRFEVIHANRSNVMKIIRGSLNGGLANGA